MMFKTVALLALSATTLAHPSIGKRAAHRHHHKWGTGTEGFAAPTGDMFPENGTDSMTFGAGSSSAPATSAITETVVPIAAPSSSSEGGQFFAASSASPVAAEVATSSSSCSSTMTSTYTSMEYVTMTVSSGTSTVSAVGNTEAFMPTSNSVAAAILTSSASDAPAGFYQKSSKAGGALSSTTAMTTFATSVVASSMVASSAAASSSAAPASSGVGGGKKGLSYNSAALTSAFANSGMSWAYNWGSSASGTLPSGVSYVPMLWGLDQVDSWASAAASAISSGSPAALSFNEPDLSSQSNMDPATAATNHIMYMNPLSVPVGSPAITNGAGTSPLMGIDWLNAFFAACAGKCKVDFVAFHWYSDASDTAYFEQHVTDVVNAAAAAGVSKVWLTEFGVTGGDASTFLATVMPFLESTPAVEKYAYFMCAAPQLLSGSSQNSVGMTYASTA